MLRCMRVVDFVERQVLSAIEAIIETVETVCREVVTQIEEWHSRWEESCESVRRNVCTWLPWPLDALCNWVTETVCKMVEVFFSIITTIVKTVCETIKSLVRILILIPMTIFVTVFRIVCFVVDFIINWVKIIIAAITGIPEFLSCLLGLRIRKHLHACVTVLADSNGRPVVSETDVDTVLQEATDLLSNRFNVRLHVHDRKIVQVPRDRLDVTACDASQLLGSDAIDLTGDANTTGAFGDLFGCGDKLLDIASELIHDTLDIIFIRDIIEGNDIGCHIPGTDYVIIDQNSSGQVLAHEIGHAGDLWHINDNTNLMNPSVGGDTVRSWQVCIFRRSRFVVYAP